MTDLSMDAVSEKSKILLELQRSELRNAIVFRWAVWILGTTVSGYLLYALTTFVERVIDLHYSALTMLAVSSEKTKSLAPVVLPDWHMMLLGASIIVAITVIVIATMRVVTSDGKSHSDANVEIPNVSLFKECLDILKTAKKVVSLKS